MRFLLFLFLATIGLVAMVRPGIESHPKILLNSQTILYKPKTPSFIGKVDGFISEYIFTGTDKFGSFGKAAGRWATNFGNLANLFAVITLAYDKITQRSRQNELERTQPHVAKIEITNDLPWSILLPEFSQVPNHSHTENIAMTESFSVLHPGETGSISLVTFKAFTSDFSVNLPLFSATNLDNPIIYINIKRGINGLFEFCKLTYHTPNTNATSIQDSDLANTRKGHGLTETLFINNLGLEYRAYLINIYFPRIFSFRLFLKKKDFNNKQFKIRAEGPTNNAFIFNDQNNLVQSQTSFSSFKVTLLWDNYFIISASDDNEKVFAREEFSTKNVKMASKSSLTERSQDNMIWALIPLSPLEPDGRYKIQNFNGEFLTHSCDPNEPLEVIFIHENDNMRNCVYFIFEEI